MDSQSPIDCLDIFIIAFAKLESMCRALSIPSLCARMLGWNWNIFVMSTDSKNFRKFCNPQIQSVQENKKINSIELCPLTLNSRNRNYYMCERMQAINFKGFELQMIPEIKLDEVQLNLHDMESILVQHELDYLQGRLLKDWATEVETY